MLDGCGLQRQRRSRASARLVVAAALHVALLCSPRASARLDRPFQRLIDKDARKPFLYIYELPSIFNAGLFKWKRAKDGPDAMSYRADRELHEYLLTHPARVEDPCLASLFFLPVYTHYMVQAGWFGGDLTFEEECRPDGVRCSYVDTAVRKAIELVRTNFPFWNESSGANHFIIFPTDGGICDGMARLLANGEAERLFSLQTQGEWARTARFNVPFAGAGPRGVPMTCFRPGIDLVIPPLIFNGSGLKPVSPLAHERNISVLARHDDWSDHFERVRPRLVHHLTNVSASFAGMGAVAAGFTNEKATRNEMAHSVFCVCPPGAAVWTGRVFRAVFNGCIPVLVFSENAQPFEGDGLNWDSFSVEFPLEVAVNDTEQLSARLRDLLLQPPLIQRLQHGLAAVQRGLSDWDRGSEEGVQATVVKALADRARSLLLFRSHRHRCSMHRAVAAFQDYAQAADERLDRYRAAHPTAKAALVFPEVLGNVLAPLAPALAEEYMAPYRQRRLYTFRLI